jgi:hypothetical protein
LAIGELVRDVINRLGSQRDNTYIFFVSDNGLHLGQHRLPPGKSTIYEEDIRVPMAVRAGHREETRWCWTWWETPTSHPRSCTSPRGSRTDSRRARCRPSEQQPLR